MECWNKADISDYSNWDGRGSFTPQEIQGRLIDEPFKLDDTTKTCALQCSTEYWSNHEATYNKAANGSDQRCNYANCKNWNSTGSSKMPPNLCTDILVTDAMVTIADTLASKLCTSVTDHSNNIVAEVYPQYSKSLRFGQYQYASQDGTNWHYVTIHYIGKGQFKYINRTFGEFWLTIEKDDNTV